MGGRSSSFGEGELGSLWDWLDLNESSRRRCPAGAQNKDLAER